MRPLSQINTGMESGLDRKVHDIDSVKVESPHVDVFQKSTVPVRRTYPIETEKVGGTEVRNRTRDRIESKEVKFEDRHWWVVTKGLFGDGLYLRDQVDVLDLLFALNLCTDDPISFSQNPGQTVRSAFKLEEQNKNRPDLLRYRGDLSPGSTPMALLGSGEMPDQVVVKGNVLKTYKMVREFRSARIESDEDMDIRIALLMYQDALTSTIWTSIANFYYVCENTLVSGFATKDEKASKIAEVTELSEPEATDWGEIVNRLKHPDKGEDITGLVDSELPTPIVKRLRQAANKALVDKMEERFNQLKEN